MKIFGVVCAPSFVCQVQKSFSNLSYEAKTQMKIRCFHDFLCKNQVLLIFYMQNDNFWIFKVLTLWCHSHIIHYKWMVLILVSMERRYTLKPYTYNNSPFRKWDWEKCSEELGEGGGKGGMNEALVGLMWILTFDLVYIYM